MQKVVVQIATFAELAANVKVALLFPSLKSTDAVLCVGVLDRVNLLLVDRADHEGFGNLLPTKFSIPHTHVLIFLLFNCSEHAVTFVGDFVRDAELPLANFLDHIELRIESVSFLKRLRDQALRARVKNEFVGARSDLDARQVAVVL